MNAEFFLALEMLESQKGISKDYMIERVEAALASAVKRQDGLVGNVRVVLDAEKQDMKVVRIYNVVESEELIETRGVDITLEEAKTKNKKAVVGGVVEEEIKTKSLGRLAAQTAKQVIIQGIREAERGIIIAQYESKKEDIITATVQRIDPGTGNYHVDTGTSNATLLKSECVGGDDFKVGDHVKVYITEVKKSKESKGPLVTLSRIHQNFVKRLFELEVPEIADGTVVIMGIVREAGSRTKLSVMSRDAEVDPVGACIGPRGGRINSILNELGGEKVDIVKYSDNAPEYIRAALAPATVDDVVPTGDRAVRAIVAADQLSLAIGKEGQNARLAARLTGHKIDIKAVVR